MFAVAHHSVRKLNDWGRADALEAIDGWLPAPTRDASSKEEEFATLVP